MLETYKPPFDATVVEKLSNAGVIMLGKTNMDEFGMGSVSTSYFGTVKNPWNLLMNKDINSETNDFYISGGSSGGKQLNLSFNFSKKLLIYKIKNHIISFRISLLILLIN